MMQLIEFFLRIKFQSKLYNEEYKNNFIEVQI